MEILDPLLASEKSKTFQEFSMQRRGFLGSVLAASALASTSILQNLNAAAAEKERDYFQLRRYRFQSGPQIELANNFFRDALVPALNRMGVNPVGVFTVTLGPDSPSIYVLMPSTSLETLIAMESRLEQDSDYLKAGAAFLNAPAKEPAYVRMENSLLVAFEGMPKLNVPPPTATRGPRIFELRTYESPSDQDHKRKVEMFNSGEIDLFEKAGFWRVFYGDTIIGSRLPNLTYMLCFSDFADRDKKWGAFQPSPDWKKLNTSPRYSYEAIVSSITNMVLSPTLYSQI